MTRYYLATAFVFVTFLSQAQTPGSGGPAPTDPVTPTEVPLDGGASLLLASGVAYGLRRLRRQRAR
jgi:hypothetical protein